MSGESGPSGGSGGPQGGPPPPPPPPPVPGGAIPSMRIQTEIPDTRGRSNQHTAPGEPPPAIQNAMMTKDKKPFTYTPGGLDLSQIKSPRIQRRIERNAHDQGTGQSAPPPPSATPGQLLPGAQIAPQAGPGGVPPPPPPLPSQGAPVGNNHNASIPQAPSAPAPGVHPAPHQIAQATVSAADISKAATSLRPTGIFRRESQNQQPPSPPVNQPQPQYHPQPAPQPQPQHHAQPAPPPQPQFHHTPAPQPQTQSYHQPAVQTQPVQVQPERSDVTINGRWRAPNEAGSLYVPPVPLSQTQRTSPTQQLGSLYIPQVTHQPVDASPTTPPPPPQRHYAPGSPQIQLQKAPTPWISQLHQMQAQQQQQQLQQQHLQQQAPPSQSQPQARIIPIQVEGQESPKVNRSPQSSPQWQQSSQPTWPPQTPPSPWTSQQSQSQWQTQQPQSPSSRQQGNTRVIPIQVEGANNASPHPWRQQSHQTPSTPDDGSGSSQWGMGPPVQSRSFKVLQKLTDTDQTDGNGEPLEQVASYSRGPFPGQAQRGQQEDPSAQLRKLQLSQDDRALMNKFKAQVDDETYLHSEADPRYRGATIPSRAFRMLQNMTGVDPDQAVPVGRPANRLANRSDSAQQVTQDQVPQPYIPPSEQTAPEPRKYTGGAIPSRSFRMLQAMTAGSENCANGRQTPMSAQQEGYNADGAGCDSQNTPYPYHSSESQWGYYTPHQQQQMWNHYTAMCAYYGYPPPPYPSGYPPYMYDPYSHWSHLYPSDSEELSGYSSTDEMAYYGANFARRTGRATPNMLHPSEAWKRPTMMRNTPKITVTSSNPDPPEHQEPKSPSVSETKESLTDSSVKKDTQSESESDSDDSESENDSSETEIEESDCPRSETRGLRSIRSVPNISTYSGSDAMDSPTTETDDQSEDSYDGEDDVVIPAEEDLPHQLSVIIEESEISETESVRRRTFTMTSEGAESSATAIDTEEDSDGDAENDSTVMVSLPLKLKFSRSENDEEVTTVIVGDVRRTSLTDSDSPGTPNMGKERPFDFTRSDAEDSDVSVTFTLPSRSHFAKSPSSDFTDEPTEAKDTFNAFNSPTHLSQDSDQNIPVSQRRNSIEVSSADGLAEVSVCLPLRRSSKPSIPESVTGSEEEDSKTKSNEESDCHWEDDSSSTSIQTVRDRAEKREINEVDTQGTQITETRTTEAEHEEKEEEEEEEEFGWGEDGTIVNIKNDRTTSEVVTHCSATENDEDESCSDCSSNSSGNGSEVGSKHRSNANAEYQQNQSHSAYKPKVANEPADVEDSSDALDESEEEAEEGKPEEVQDIVRNIIASIKTKPLEHSMENGLNILVSEAVPSSDVQGNTEKKGESEEEDSGVTSDMSRHISEAENEDALETNKKRKLSRYQRASTHSRLFKLLQEESAMNDQDEAALDPLHVPSNDFVYGQPPPLDNINSRKECLTLPLLSNISDPDSLSSSSGITSPASPTVTDRLVTNLVQTLLQRKKGKKFRKLPMTKLHAAALRILQEDMDPYDTLSSTSEEGGNRLQMSPVNVTSNCENPTDGVQSSPYGSNYTDYCDYYNSWDGTAIDYIMPSKAFKLLNQHAMSGLGPGIIEGLSAKCPRVRSSKQINRDLAAPSVVETDPQSPQFSQNPSIPNNTGTVTMVREDH